MFSKNTKQPARIAMMNELQLSSTAQNDKYLGLPMHVGTSKTRTFAYLKDKVWNTRVEGETFVKGGERDSNQSCRSSYTDICHVVLRSHKDLLQPTKHYGVQILVESAGQ